MNNTASTTEFDSLKTFKSALRNAPVIHFSAEAMAAQKAHASPAGCGTTRTIKVDGLWVKVEG